MYKYINIIYQLCIIQIYLYKYIYNTCTHKSIYINGKLLNLGSEYTGDNFVLKFQFSTFFPTFSISHFHKWKIIKPKK